MSTKQYEKTIAKLVSKIDHLETELVYLNRILIQAGFPEGIRTLKDTVEELLEVSSENTPFAIGD
jgi:type II secretory pathway component PulJ